MTLPSLRTKPGPRGFADIPIEDEEEDNQNFDVPQSQEEKPESYPNGPIRIYEDGVDLFYEPNVEVASRYDVIFNVASEVKNPFTVAAEAGRSPPIALPTSNMGVLAKGSENAASPDTPKATPLTTQMPAPALPLKQPEYIHIPWEHNTDLVPDLHKLVKVIDEKVQQGKRVLVHCQCGVSRSATLIVAYGIYKNPGISVQEAYDAVKKRSKWIGPNMNLIMQLQEFRSGLFRNSRRENGFDFTMPRNMPNALSSASTVGSFDAGSNPASAPLTPRTAPLPPDDEKSASNRARGNSLGPKTAAPLENHESPFWQNNFRRSWGEGERSPEIDGRRLSAIPDTPYVDTRGHIVPMMALIDESQDAPEGEVQVTHSSVHIQPQEPARTKSQKRKTPNFSRTLPLRRDADGDSPMTDAPPIPMASLMSPRSEEFGMIGVMKDALPKDDDSFGLFSPMRTDFPEFPREIPVQPSAPQVAVYPSINEVTPMPSRPPPDLPSTSSFSGFTFFDQSQSQSKPEGLSVMSPTVSTFPRDLPLRSESPLPAFNQSLLTPRKNMPRSLKTKFSSPNMQEALRLQRIQDEIAPKRHMDDLDALMSPRATAFTTNPFHELLAVKPTETQVLETPQKAPQPLPVTPTSSDVDPRSPAQMGISPITRNIFDVL
jgi:tyrosine-protein phosphatase MSG5